MRAEEMRAKAIECAERSRGGDPMARYFFLHAAQQWNDMADQMELLEREPVYRMIRNRSE
jgi:hypothetical protein